MSFAHSDYKLAESLVMSFAQIGDDATLSGELLTAMIGAVCGIVAAVATTLAAKWLEHRKEDQFTVNKYARPIWVATETLDNRLKQILNKLNQEPDNVKTLLNWRIEGEREIEWMNGEGYYLMSSAYLLSRLSCWFYIIERNLVFLPFRQESQAAEFSVIIKQVKEDMTSNSPLWYHYFAGIGQLLVDENKEQPISYVEFVLKMNDSGEFRDFFEHLMSNYFFDLGHNRITPQIEIAESSLRKLRHFLLKSSTIPLLEYGIED